MSQPEATSDIALRRLPTAAPSGACAHVIAASEAANDGDGMAGELAAQTHCALTHKLRAVHTSGCLVQVSTH